jgi:hypothetical protein
MMKMRSFSFIALLLASNGQAKEIALTFDDAPFEASKFYESEARTEALIAKLKALKVPRVIVFANGCKREDPTRVLK